MDCPQTYVPRIISYSRHFFPLSNEGVRTIVSSTNKSTALNLIIRFRLHTVFKFRRMVDRATRDPCMVFLLLSFIIPPRPISGWSVVLRFCPKRLRGNDVLVHNTLFDYSRSPREHTTILGCQWKQQFWKKKKKSPWSTFVCGSFWDRLVIGQIMWNVILREQRFRFLSWILVCSGEP